MADNTEPQNLRESYDALKTDHGKLQKTNADLATENRTLKAQGFGLSEAQAKVFVSSNPEDVSKEAVDTFVKTLGLTVPGTEGAAEPKTAESAPAPASAQGGATNESSTSNQGMALMGQAGSTGGDGGQPTAGTEYLSTAQLSELQKKDPQAAAKAIREGRVRFSEDNFYVTAGLVPQK